MAECTTVSSEIGHSITSNCNRQTRLRRIRPLPSSAAQVSTGPAMLANLTRFCRGVQSSLVITLFLPVMKSGSMPSRPTIVW
jgi:hypothetical protein